MKIKASRARAAIRAVIQILGLDRQVEVVVGSSAISRRGSHEMPMAPTMRCRMPPDISWGYCLSASRATGCDRLEELARLRPAVERDAVVHAIGSATWLPMLNSGFGEPSDPAGSWRCACRGFAHLGVRLRTRSSPSNSIRPLTIRRRRQHRNIVSASVLLPEPLRRRSQGLAGIEAQRPRRPPAPPGASRRHVVRRQILQTQQRLAGHGQSCRSCGSNLTRSQSPSRLADSTMSMMQQPGNTVSHQ